MNWKEQPSLFHGFEVETERKQKLPIVGATLDNKRLILQASNVQFHCDINNCQLIARPIEDMDNAEVARALRRQDIEHEGRDFRYFKNLLLDMVNEDFDEKEEHEYPMIPLTAKAQNYLLSIGVYPFSDTEDVIFKPKQS